MPRKAADDQVKAAPEKAEKVEKVEKAAPEAPDVIEVILAADHPTGTHTVYLQQYRVEFVNGTATVPPEVADELRQLGIIK